MTSEDGTHSSFRNVVGKFPLMIMCIQYALYQDHVHLLPPFPYLLAAASYFLTSIKVLRFQFITVAAYLQAVNSFLR
jgi:hypothetical protein